MQRDWRLRVALVDLVDAYFEATRGLPIKQRVNLDVQGTLARARRALRESGDDSPPDTAEHLREKVERLEQRHALLLGKYTRLKKRAEWLTHYVQRTAPAASDETSFS